MEWEFDQCGMDIDFDCATDDSVIYDCGNTFFKIEDNYNRMFG